MKFCSLLVLAGVLLLLIGHGWTPLICCLLAGIVVSAFAGHFLTGK